jgi:CubicO group peptidase (beta-lactamase class C family)
LESIVARAKAWKHVILLAIIVCVFVSQSLAPDRGVLGPMLHDALVTLAMLSVFLVVFEGRADRFVALAAGIVSIGCSWARYALPAHGGTTITIVHDCALALFFSFAVVEILRNIFRQRAIRADDVIGSVCGYLLAGAAWASLYSLVDYVVPESFSLSRSVGMQLDGWHSRHALFDYFSVVTLTTMGYGDVVPLRAPAMTLSWLEAVFGQFYIAVVVAQLVAVRLMQSLKSGNQDPR